MEHKTNTTRTQVLPKKKPITSLFLDKEKRQSILALQKAIKDKYAQYKPGDVKKSRLKDLALDMWNSMQNEFYMTASICDNTVWHWQDELEKFDEQGYLIERTPEELTDWTKLCKGWYDRNRLQEVLNLVRDFNLDCQPSEFVEAFQSDFRAAKNNDTFCSAIYKWTDLIYWSPWKLSLLDSTYFQPKSAHYEDDFNPDVDDAESDIFLD